MHGNAGEQASRRAGAQAGRQLTAVVDGTQPRANVCNGLVPAKSAPVALQRIPARVPGQESTAPPLRTLGQAPHTSDNAALYTASSKCYACCLTAAGRKPIALQALTATQPYRRPSMARCTASPYRASVSG